LKKGRNEGNILQVVARAFFLYKHFRCLTQLKGVYAISFIYAEKL
jgi:hypothetical protein